MSDVALVANQVRYEQKMYWRNPASAFFTFAFPLMFLVIFASINKNATIGELGGISYNQYYIPSIIAFGVMSACYTNLAISLVYRREVGILKRLHGTPLPTWGLFGGLMGNALLVSLLTSAITLTAGVLLYNVDAPYRWGPLIVSVLLGAACFCALGVAVSTFVPNADAAPAVVNFPFFLLVFVSGIWFPVPADSWLGKLGNFFPLTHFREAVFSSFDPRVVGSGWPWHELLQVGIWAVVAALVAVRRFRWEPRRG